MCLLHRNTSRNLMEFVMYNTVGGLCRRDYQAVDVWRRKLKQLAFAHTVNIHIGTEKGFANSG